MSETPPWRAFVPGRLEIFGKHTDYAGGHSLVAAVPRGMTVTAQRTADGAVMVVDERSGEHSAFSARGDAGSSDGWRRYPLTVIRRLVSNFPNADLSARISLSSDLPQAAGLSSSSALVIAIVESLIACAGLEETAEWRAAITTREDRAAYFGCIENGSAFGPLAGDTGVGTHGGSEDHAAILLSRAGHLQQFSFSAAGTPAPRLASSLAGTPTPRSAPRLLHSERLVKMPAGWTFVIAWSGVHAEKAGAARAAYNRLANPAAMIGPRLQQFVAEDARVLEAADAFARADIGAVGELAADSQRDADLLLGNQVPETRDLVALALDAGAAAASSFGAGWGGSVWALIPEAGADVFAGAWHGAYRARYPHLSSGAFISPPEKGTGLISPDENSRN